MAGREHPTVFEICEENTLLQETRHVNKVPLFNIIM